MTVLVSGSVATLIMTEVMHTDTDSLVRLNNNASPLDSQNNVEEKTEKCEISRPTPIQLPDKKPWLTPPMVPTPLLPLPTLSFTVSQVRVFKIFFKLTDFKRFSSKKLSKLQYVCNVGMN